MNIYRLTENKDSWVLDLGKRVTACRLGLGFDVQLFDGEDMVNISIGREFLLVEGDKVTAFDPNQPTTLCPALTIIGKTVISAIAYKNGHLEVNFADDTLLKTGPDPQYESWQIQGRNPLELMIVCTPGGGLAVWASD